MNLYPAYEQRSIVSSNAYESGTEIHSNNLPMASTETYSQARLEAFKDLARRRFLDTTFEDIISLARLVVDTHAATNAGELNQLDLQQSLGDDEYGSALFELVCDSWNYLPLGDPGTRFGKLLQDYLKYVVYHPTAKQISRDLNAALQRIDPNHYELQLPKLYTWNLSELAYLDLNRLVGYFLPAHVLDKYPDLCSEVIKQLNQGLANFTVICEFSYEAGTQTLSENRAIRVIVADNTVSLFDITKDLAIS